MSYVDEIYERVVAQNPGEPEFHQAVKEVLDSLRLVIDANEDKYAARLKFTGAANDRAYCFFPCTVGR